VAEPATRAPTMMTSCPQVGAEGRVGPLDPVEHVADAGGDGLAGPFGLVAKAPGPAAEAGGGGQLGHQDVPFQGGPGGPLRVVPAGGLLGLGLQVQQPGPELAAGPLVQHLVGPQPRRRRLPGRRGDQVGGVDRPARGGQQGGQVAQALGVAHPHRAAAVAEGPQGPVAPEHAAVGGPSRRPPAGLQPLQLLAAAPRPGPGAEALVGGHGPLQVGAGRRLLAEGRGQHPQVVGDRAPEHDRRPHDRRPGGVGEQGVVQPAAGRPGAEGGRQLGREAHRPQPVAVGREPGRDGGVELWPGGLGGLAVAALQQDRGLEVAARRGVVGEQRPGLIGQLGAAALEAAELPQLDELDVGGVRLADLAAEGGRVGDQALGLGGPPGQQRLGGQAGAGGVAQPRLAQVGGDPQELGQLGRVAGVGQLQQVGRPQQPGLGQQLQVAGAAGQLGHLAGRGQPLGRVLRPPAGVVLGQQAGGEQGRVAGPPGGGAGLGGQVGRPVDVHAVPGQLPGQGGQHPGPQGRVPVAEGGGRLLQHRDQLVDQRGPAADPDGLEAEGGPGQPVGVAARSPGQPGRSQAGLPAAGQVAGAAAGRGQLQQQPGAAAGVGQGRPVEDLEGPRPVAGRLLVGQAPGRLGGGQGGVADGRLRAVAAGLGEVAGQLGRGDPPPASRSASRAVATRRCRRVRSSGASPSRMVSRNRSLAKR